MEPSSQTPGSATVTQAGLDTTVPLVNMEGKGFGVGGGRVQLLHCVACSQAPNCRPPHVQTHVLFLALLVVDASPLSEQTIKKLCPPLVQPGDSKQYCIGHFCVALIRIIRE